MRVVLVTYGSRGDVEPMASLALQLRALGTAVRVCAPPDFRGLLADIGIPLTPLGWPIRALATGAIVTVPKTLPDIAIELIPMTYDAVAAVANGCDAVVATGSLPAVAATQAAAEKLDVPFGFASSPRRTCRHLITGRAPGMARSWPQTRPTTGFCGTPSTST
jgi:vancomycin aglycone glucosyltransferase